MPANMESSSVATGLEKVSFHFNPKESSDYVLYNCTQFHMLARIKILQTRLQQYVNCELPNVQAGFRKGRGTRDQIANMP